MATGVPGSAMMTYRTGAAGAPSAALAMARHLLEHTLPAEQM